MSKAKRPKPEPNLVNRIVLALMTEGIVDALEHTPSPIDGINFTKAEYAQARRDHKRLSKLYDEKGRFLRGHALSRLILVADILKTDTPETTGGTKP